MVLLLRSGCQLICKIRMDGTRSIQFQKKRMLAHLTKEVSLKKGEYKPSRETKSKHNLVFRFDFLLLSYSLRLCTWVRFSIHHPRSIYLIGEILFSSFNKPFILLKRFGTSTLQTHFSPAGCLFCIFFFFQNIF